MHELRKILRNCPAPLVIEEGGHFLQEWGDQVTRWFLSQT
jgi:haloalkane dehalogenase